MLTIKLAGCVIGIENQYSYLEQMCRDYLTEETPECLLSVSMEEIKAEQRKLDEFSLDILENTAIHRKICENLLEKDVILFHCSAIAVDGKAYLFAALSGTGKSTHVKMLKEHMGERAAIINDDKPLLRFEQNGIYAYGTPWNGKHHLGSNVKVKVEAVILLERAGQNHGGKINGKEAFPTILNQIYRPADVNALLRTVELAKELTDSVALYKIGCNMEKEAAVMTARLLKIEEDRI